MTCQLFMEVALVGFLRPLVDGVVENLLDMIAIPVDRAEDGGLAPARALTVGAGTLRVREGRFELDWCTLH